MPPKLVDKGIWDERLTDIARFEDYLTRQGVVVLKFYLNLSRKEQK
jgi:polyphosphate kinase 2 (PPK2 family)